MLVGASTTSAKPTTSTSSSPEATANVPVLVDIGQRRRLSVHCSGTGSPTVVLESGSLSVSRANPRPSTFATTR
jgi:hypothetical protein